MSLLKRILVGVDPQAYFSHVADLYEPSTEVATTNGIWLARKNHARLHFLSSIEVVENLDYLDGMEWGIDSDWTDDIEQRLDAMVRRAEAAGVEADYSLVSGRGWVEIIRRAVKHHHDMVLVGTHHHGNLGNVLLGSTGIKLLRKCPCPVWISQQTGYAAVESVLVADDLSPVSDRAIDLGVAMAHQLGAQLHVMHALELGIGRREWDSFQVRNRLREKAAKRIQHQLNHAEASRLELPAKTEIMVGAPGAEILNYVKKQNINLLVIGTIARGGVDGILTGNTAEHLLPRSTCSMVAVKPDNFVCPIAAV